MNKLLMPFLGCATLTGSLLALGELYKRGQGQTYVEQQRQFGLQGGHRCARQTQVAGLNAPNPHRICKSTYQRPGQPRKWGA